MVFDSRSRDEMSYGHGDRLATVSQQDPVSCGRRNRRSTSGLNDEKLSCRGVKGTAVKAFIVLLAANFLLLVDSIEWLAVAKRRDAYWNKTSECHLVATEGLVRQQRNLCAKNLDLMPTIVYSARQMAQVCQETFYDSRWNCSSVLLAPNYNPDLNGGSREQAFAYALAAASLTQSVSKACSAGTTVRCSCGSLPREVVPPSDSPEEQFQWGGCSDDIKFGLEFGQMFVEAGSGTGKSKPSSKSKSRISKRTLMNNHNYLVGRKATSDSLTKACKCHGVSGSCSMKTCWKALPDLRVVSALLLNAYSTAAEVTFRRPPKPQPSQSPSEGGSVARGNEKRLVPVAWSFRKNFTNDDLVFYTMSPDYCLPDASLGSVGTKDRECNKSEEAGSASCRSMCCGRGFNSQIVEMQYRCECKYYWCCYVKCKTCSQEVEVNRCR